MRNFAYFIPPTIIEPSRVQIVLPAFSLVAPIWAGASGILAEYPIDNTAPFSFKLPIEQFGENFIAAIRWMEDGDIFVRYKLFEHDDAVLYYPLYDGEQIGENAVLEIWSVNSTDAPTLDIDYTLYSSQLVFPAGETTQCSACCQNSESVITLVATPASELPPGAACNPFCGDLCNTEPPMPECDCPIVVKETVVDARAYTPATFVSPALLVTQGGGAVGDGFNKTFRWNAASMAVDDGTIYTVNIRPNSINAAAPGRWEQTSLA